MNTVPPRPPKVEMDSTAAQLVGVMPNGGAIQIAADVGQVARVAGRKRLPWWSAASATTYSANLPFRPENPVNMTLSRIFSHQVRHHCVPKPASTAEFLGCSVPIRKSRLAQLHNTAARQGSDVFLARRYRCSRLICEAASIS